MCPRERKRERESEKERVLCETLVVIGIEFDVEGVDVNERTLHSRCSPRRLNLHTQTHTHMFCQRGGDTMDKSSTKRQSLSSLEPCSLVTCTDRPCDNQTHTQHLQNHILCPSTNSRGHYISCSLALAVCARDHIDVGALLRHHEHKEDELEEVQPA